MSNALLMVPVLLCERFSEALDTGVDRFHTAKSPPSPSDETLSVDT